jgi:hypothetical protein
MMEENIEKEEKSQDPKDVCWQQRFANYNKALAQLTGAIE